MIDRNLLMSLLKISLAILCLAGSRAAMAEAAEQRIWLDVVDPGGLRNRSRDGT